MNNNIFKKIALPLLLLAIILSLYFIWKFLNLPAEDELILIAKEYFEKYGLMTVFISSMIEGLLLVGFYYPGSLVIFLGVIFAGKNVGQVAEVISIVTLGLSISYMINFFLGKYGWHRLLISFGLKESIKNAEHRLQKYGLSAMWMTYWQPSLAALTSTSAGILQFEFKKFSIYSITITFLWNTFWGALVYFLGEASLSIIGLRFVVIAIVAWIGFRIWFKKSPIEKELNSS